MYKILIILSAFITFVHSQGNHGPFDPRCPEIDDALNPFHLAHESNCTLFYKCFNRMRILFPCPPSLEWGHMEPCIGTWCACEWPWSAQCVPANLPPLPPSNETTTAPTTTTTTTTTTEPPSGSRCPLTDNPNTLIFLPHETFCDRYYLCFNGGMIERSCALGLLWDQSRTWCNFPNFVDCPTNDCPVPDDEDNPLFLPNYEACDKYFLCFNGTKIPRDCAEGLLWSRSMEWCDFEDNVVCGFSGMIKYWRGWLY